MSYLKDKVIINFLCELEKLANSQDIKLAPIYYFAFGFCSYAYTNEPKNLHSVFVSFFTLYQYEELQAISESQKRKILTEHFADPKGYLELKIYATMSSDMEESKEREQVRINRDRLTQVMKIYEATEDILAEHLALTENHERLQAIDLIIWGFYCSHYFQEFGPKIIFEKLFIIKQSELSGLLNHNQKMRIFLKLYEDWRLDLDESLLKFFENPSLGSDPLSSLIETDDQHCQQLADEIALEEQSEKVYLNYKEITCSICFISLYDNDEDLYVLDSCPHCFHESCLSTYALNELKEGKVPIKCPENSCNVEFTTYDLKELLDKTNLEKFYKLSLDLFIQRNGKEMSCCPSPGCPYAFVLNSDETNFRCPVCQKSFCLKCKQETHFGDCNASEFLKLAESMNFKACPSCKFWVERTQGCNHMKCRCRNDFCYECGEIWDIDHYSCKGNSNFNYYESALESLLAENDEAWAADPKNIPQMKKKTSSLRKVLKPKK